MAMASSRIIMKTHQNLRKSTNPHSIFVTKHLTAFPSDNTGSITKDLISIFTKQPFCPNNPQLRTLSPMLNPKVVETVLSSFKSWKIAHMFFTWASSQYPYKHNIYTYNTMASILSRDRQNAALRALCVDIVNSRCSMSPGSLGFFIRCLGNVGLVHEASFLFDEVQMMGLCVPNNYSYNCLLEAISSAGSIDLVEMRLKEMRDRGWGFDKYTLTPVLQVYCNAGEFNKASDVFNEIYDHGWVDAHVCSILAVSFSEWGKVDKAFELIERMEDQNVKLNEKTFSVLIRCFVKESRVDRALQLFYKMRKCGITPHISLFNVLIGGLCTNNELEKALHLYSEMKKLKIQPDVQIITKLISSCSEERELIHLLEEICDNPDVGARTLLYNSVLDFLVNKGLINKAYYLLRAMMGDNCNDDSEIDKLLRDKEMTPPNITAFIIVINGLLKAGELDLALSIFRDMARIGCRPGLLLYNNLIDGLCNSNRLEESYELLREMEESGFEPTQFTHNSIFGCLCRKQDISGALDLVKKMRVHGHEPWIKHSTLLAKELCKHGKAVKACKFLADMVQEGFNPDIIAYSAALDGLVKTQEVDQALKLFQDICARGYCPDVIAYNILIKGLCKCQRIKEATNLLNEMEMKGLVPSVVTYNLLIDGLCKNDHVDEAMLYLSRTFGKEKEPNVITYTTLINGLCKAGRPDDALVLWNEMQGKGFTPSNVSFMAFIHGLCKCGRPNAALPFFNEMKEKKIKADTFVYVALISAFLADLNLPMAFEILKEMVDEGNLPYPHDKNYIIVRDAVIKLSEDASTSSRVKNLIAGGNIPTISLSDIGSAGGVEPTI